MLREKTDLLLSPFLLTYLAENNRRRQQKSHRHQDRNSESKLSEFLVDDVGAHRLVELDLDHTDKFSILCDWNIGVGIHTWSIGRHPGFKHGRRLSAQEHRFCVLVVVNVAARCFYDVQVGRYEPKGTIGAEELIKKYVAETLCLFEKLPVFLSEGLAGK
ncbi:MAG: hypothetical protein ACR2OX_05370, partial [Methyloligellaceae bacterium]